MSAEGEHLDESARRVLGASKAGRIRYLQGERWIGYPRALKILDQLDALLWYPQRQRMPNLLIVGDTNNGKSMIARRFAERYQPYEDSLGERAQVPVLLIDAPPIPDENRLYNRMLEALHAPHQPRGQVAEKHAQVLHLLQQVNLRMLIIDEIQHGLAGYLHKQRQFLNVLKDLGNHLHIPLVGVGTREALRALQTDPQLANRFRPAALPRWTLDDDFRRLLASLESMLPLKRPSELYRAPLARTLLAMSEGSLGELGTLLVEAATHAIRTGQENIDAGTLAALDWVAPSDRKRHVEQML